MWTQVEDAFTSLVRSGYNPEDLLKMSCEAFGEAFRSYKRVEARERMWQFNAAVVAAHPCDSKGKPSKGLKSLEAAMEVWIPYSELKQGMKGSEDLIKRYQQGLNKG
jgi:hypothetical protein